jgi:hypothetical protein
MKKTVVCTTLAIILIALVSSFTLLSSPIEQAYYLHQKAPACRAITATMPSRDTSTLEYVSGVIVSLVGTDSTASTSPVLRLNAARATISAVYTAESTTTYVFSVKHGTAPCITATRTTVAVYSSPSLWGRVTRQAPTRSYLVEYSVSIPAPPPSCEFTAQMAFNSQVNP